MQQHEKNQHFFFFFSYQKLGVRLIHVCAVYTRLYSIQDFFFSFSHLPKLYIGFNRTLENLLNEPAMTRIHLFHRFSRLYDAGDLLLYI